MGDEKWSDTYNSDQSGYDYYLVAPTGEVLKYESKSQNYNGERIAYNLPRDPITTLFYRLFHYNYPVVTEKQFREAWYRSDSPSPYDTLVNLGIIEDEEEKEE